MADALLLSYARRWSGGWTCTNGPQLEVEVTQTHTINKVKTASKNKAATAIWGGKGALMFNPMPSFRRV